MFNVGRQYLKSSHHRVVCIVTWTLFHLMTYSLSAVIECTCVLLITIIIIRATIINQSIASVILWIISIAWLFHINDNITTNDSILKVYKYSYNIYIHLRCTNYYN
jgi:hypothetical protein